MGSCLGLGGLCADSAPAVVLDVNKQALYARDHRGTFVARQIVAMAGDQRLVCFEVHPRGTGSEIKCMFREYDRQQSKAVAVAGCILLRIPLDALQ